MNTGRFDVKLEEEVVGITAATLANYDVLVNYYYGPRWGETTEHAVEDFLKSGHGMIGIHGVTYGPFLDRQEGVRRNRVAWKASRGCLFRHAAA